MSILNLSLDIEKCRPPTAEVGEASGELDIVPVEELKIVLICGSRAK